MASPIVDKEYFAFLNLLKDVPGVPNGFLYLHPDFDEPDEQAYYNRYLSELFFGDIPKGFDNIPEWEGLWLQAFAADPVKPLDFSDGDRSPSRTLAVNYSAYFTKKTGDLNGDGLVDGQDYQALRTTLGKCKGDEAFNQKADYDADHCVSYGDYRIWYIEYYMD